jgi:hypothetical protein
MDAAKVKEDPWILSTGYGVKSAFSTVFSVYKQSKYTRRNSKTFFHLTLDSNAVRSMALWRKPFARHLSLPSIHHNSSRALARYYGQTEQTNREAIP